MKFHFDESGDFRVPLDPTGNAVGITVGVVIPNETADETHRVFDAFVRGLLHSAFQDGEPKGHRLDAAARRQFADFIWGCDGILICPIMLDLTALAGRTDMRN